MSKVPMKRTQKYPAQTSVNFSLEIERKMKELKGRGVDVGELRRIAVTKAIEEAYQEIIAS